MLTDPWSCSVAVTWGHFQKEEVLLNIICKKFLYIALLTRCGLVTPYGDRSGSALAQVMACCLTAPSHYLKQCWLIISQDLWHLPEDNFRWNGQYIYPWYEFENHWFKVTATFPWDQWVKMTTTSHSDQGVKARNGKYQSLTEVSRAVVEALVFVKP